MRERLSKWRLIVWCVLISLLAVLCYFRPDTYLLPAKKPVVESGPSQNSKQRRADVFREGDRESGVSPAAQSARVDSHVNDSNVNAESFLRKYYALREEALNRLCPVTDSEVLMILQKTPPEITGYMGLFLSGKISGSQILSNSVIMEAMNSTQMSYLFLDGSLSDEEIAKLDRFAEAKDPTNQELKLLSALSKMKSSGDLSLIAGIDTSHLGGFQNTFSTQLYDFYTMTLNRDPEKAFGFVLYEEGGPWLNTINTIVTDLGNNGKIKQAITNDPSQAEGIINILAGLADSKGLSYRDYAMLDTAQAKIFATLPGYKDEYEEWIRNEPARRSTLNALRAIPQIDQALENQDQIEFRTTVFSDGAVAGVNWLRIHKPELWSNIQNP